MDIFGMNISDVVDIGTQVATAGAIGTVGLYSDEIFELIISIAIIVYELDPG